MNVMHASYACGALLGPILITAALLAGDFAPMYALAVLGLVLWLVFVAVRFPGKRAETADGKKEKTDWSFLKEKKFWLLIGLITGNPDALDHRYGGRGCQPAGQHVLQYCALRGYFGILTFV